MVFCVLPEVLKHMSIMSSSWDGCGDEDVREMHQDHQHLIQHEMGDVFDAPENFSLVHCVAEDMVMTKGVAKTFQDRFGRRNELLAQKKKMGEVAMLKDGRRYIFYLIGKERTNSRPVYPDVLLKCLETLRKVCLELNITKLAMPKLGHGYNKLNWDIIEQHINELFIQQGFVVNVYHILFVYQAGILENAPPHFSTIHPVPHGFTIRTELSCKMVATTGRLCHLVRIQKEVGDVAYQRDGKHIIFYLITRASEDEHSNLVNIKKCFKSLRCICDRLSIRRLAMNKMTSHIGHLTWDNNIMPSINNLFLSSGIEILIYEAPIKLC
ncbi:hypothetical protein B566_EDAN010995 [Ephemera danica]|nr:hypothetical protein B566_EDAN010995 [Ephemera danica]